MPTLVLILVWITLGAAQDWRHRMVSNRLILPGLAFGVLVRIAGFGIGRWAEVGIVLTLVTVGWWLKWVGSADVKGTLAIALISVPLAAWAWGGVMVGLIFLKMGNVLDHRRFPGFIGFAAGITANFIIKLIGG